MVKFVLFLFQSIVMMRYNHAKVKVISWEVVKLNNVKDTAKREFDVYLRCSCNCSMFVVQKTIWASDDISYNITVQDSRYDHNYTTILGRIKTAFTILFGKPMCYNDVYIGDNPERFRQFVNELSELCDKGQDIEGE